MKKEELEQFIIEHMMISPYELCEANGIKSVKGVEDYVPPKDDLAWARWASKPGAYGSSIFDPDDARGRYLTDKKALDEEYRKEMVNLVKWWKEKGIYEERIKDGRNQPHMKKLLVKLLEDDRDEI